MQARRFNIPPDIQILPASPIDWKFAAELIAIVGTGIALPWLLLFALFQGWIG
jgi:hypothetical protein